MQYTVPHYYSKFTCIADKCPDTCCAGWQIAIDEKTMKKYKREKGILKNRLRNEIDLKNRVFHQYDGRCAFLNEENLCDLYLEGGRSMFCKTCRMYPRHVEEFEGLREISLSLSCPAAAHLILGSTEKVRFIQKERCDVEEKPFKGFDYFLFTKLMDARDILLSILQNREISIQIRMVMALALAHDFQQRIDKNRLSEVEGLLERYARADAANWFCDHLKLAEEEELGNKEPGKKESERERQVLRELFHILDQLEVLREDWRGYITKTKERLFEDKTNIFKEKLPSSLDVIWEQIMVYLVFTYFTGAVYDGNAYGKMKFSLAGTLIIRELIRVEWIEKNGQIGQDEIEEAARRYSREIEHSDYNKQKMEEMLNDETIYGIDDFIGLILE